MFLHRKRLLVLFLVVLISCSYAVCAEEQINLYAGSAALIDGESGRLLYGKEQDTPLPMASTTKIMTCIVALEQAEADLLCMVTPNAAAQPKVKLGMLAGDSFYLKDLLYSLMLESHNDTAVCIAEAVAGSTEDFADLMNEKAAEIGCEHTYFITPNGLDEENENGVHHTTAYELSMIMRYCLTQSHMREEFLEITQTQFYDFTNAVGTKHYNCSNHNALLTIMDGALSGKTGFTNKAGYCYVGAVKQNDRLLIVSLLACGWPNNKGYKWVDTKKLIRYGLENFERREITDQELMTDPVVVTGGKEEWVRTTLQREMQEGDRGAAFSKHVLMRPEESVEISYRIEEKVSAPVTEGSVLGYVSFLVDGHIYASCPIVAQNAVEKKDYPWCLKLAWRYWLPG